MTTALVCVSENTPLTEALAIARHRSIRHIPVLDAQRQCIGVITQRDIMNAYISLVETQVKLEEQNRTLEGLSLEDALMGIGNRRAMEADLVFSQEMARRYSTSYAVALLDLDFFKRYNDALGHQAGDFALQATAKVLKTCIRETDRIYRYGGEEILVLMRGTTLPDAELAAQRFCQAIQKLALRHPDSPYQVLTASVGVAAGLGDDWQTLVAQADRALYRAKEGGRNRVVSAAVI
jgi:diguanylate cyclase (GGDEF)-like protein